MEIAIDVGPLKTGDSIRGIGVYTRELLKALKIDGVDVFNTDLNKFKVVHFTRFNPFRVSIPFYKPSGVKFVLTIYDLIPLIYRKNYPPGVRGGINWIVNKYLIKKNIDAVITISVTSKKDICRFVGISPDRVHVAHLAPRSEFKKLENGSWMEEIKNKYNLPDRFALYVGDVNYNKNIPLLVNATKMAGIQLVIVGKQAAEIEKMDLEHPELRHLKKLNFEDIVRTGFVPDADLVKIYNLADIYVQPSLYEGFGLPLLEAQATSVPVVAAKTQALVEISEDSAIFADPKDVNDFANKIKNVLTDNSLRKNLIEKGQINAKKYTWKKTADITLKVYNE